MSDTSPNVLRLPMGRPIDADLGNARIIMLGIAVGLIPADGRRVIRLASETLQKAG